ncbi:MAG TPA: hypothetical protein VN457_03805, partial [Chlamydiales bacterium]|nr:hypothetical protein [Chlamydiales bacterium]
MRKLKKKHDPRSEAAQRAAIKAYDAGIGWIGFSGTGPAPIVYILRGETEVLAIFDLRDCYRKRQPLKGITKKLRKAIQ